MPESPLKLIKRFAEFQPKVKVASLPRRSRGLYVLYQKRRRIGKEHFNVVYVGMTTSSMRRRLKVHMRKKSHLWTHFSAFEVWENIRDEEIIELEGLFRHLYRKDAKASVLNVQRAFKMAKKVRNNSLETWT